MTQYPPNESSNILLHPSDADLPIAHLQLSTRNLRSLRSLKIQTIGQLVEAVSNGALSKWNLGERSAAEIERIFGALPSLLNQEGRVNWPMYWASLTELPHHLALTSVALESLSSEVRSLPVTTLNLAKAGITFRTAGIDTLGDLLHALRVGLRKLKNFGALAKRDVVESVMALSNAATPDGQVDWLCYAETRGLPVLPKKTIEGDRTPKEFISLLPQLAREVIQLQFGERERKILERRLLAATDQRRTLEEIGQVFNLSRERVRQLEDKVVKALRNPLMSDDYGGLRFRLLPGLAAPLREASDYFVGLGISAWRRDQWIADLTLLWQVDETKVSQVYLLLCKLLGYDEVRLEHSNLETLVYHLDTPSMIVNRTVAAVDAIHEGLLNTPEGADDFDLVNLANQHLSKDHKIRIDEIPTLSALASSVEVIGDETYRLKMAYLRSRGDQAVRVLSDTGTPMTKGDLAKEINRLRGAGDKSVKVNNVVNQITSDPRIEAIAKSGLWALTVWGSETRTIVDIIEDCLHATGEAMTEDEIYDFVAKLRPIAKASVPLTLMQHPRFARVTLHTWGLRAWGDLDTGKWWDSDAIGQFVEKWFTDGGKERAAFDALREAVQREFGYSSRSAKGVLVRHPSISVEKPNQREWIAVFRPAWRGSPPRRHTAQRRKPLVRDRIAQAIRTKLEVESTHELPLIDLVRQVEIEVGVPRPSVYAVVQQSDEFEAVAVGASSYKICRLVGQTRPEFPELRQILSTTWSSELQRAIDNINIEDVDIGLFMVGRQFESCMKALLNAADRRGDPPVSEGNKTKLNNMIDWALSRGLFADRGTIHLLRNERNERAHQPPLAERSAILKAAPFLVRLYLDYIIIIQNQLITWNCLGDVDGKS